MMILHCPPNQLNTVFGITLPHNMVVTAAVYDPDSSILYMKPETNYHYVAAIDQRGHNSRFLFSPDPLIIMEYDKLRLVATVLHRERIPQTNVVFGEPNIYQAERVNTRIAGIIIEKLDCY